MHLPGQICTSGALAGQPPGSKYRPSWQVAAGVREAAEFDEYYIYQEIMISNMDRIRVLIENNGTTKIQICDYSIIFTTEPC